MGEQRRTTEALMEYYLVSQDSAWELVKLFEAVEIVGDDLYDATYIIARGEREKGLKELDELHEKLGKAIENLKRQIEPQKKRL